MLSGIFPSFIFIPELQHCHFWLTHGILFIDIGLCELTVPYARADACLQDATAHFGKWHLGASTGNVVAPNPSAYGINESVSKTLQSTRNGGGKDPLGCILMLCLGTADGEKERAPPTGKEAEGRENEGGEDLKITEEEGFA